MKIASFAGPDGCEAVGMVLDEGILDLSRALQIYQLVEEGGQMPLLRTILDFLEAGLFSVETFLRLREFIENRNLMDRLLVREQYQLLAPIRRPPAIYCLGRNFPAHARESGADVPREPIVFNKAVTSVVGHEEPVIYRKFYTRVDPEAELAVVIAKKGSNIPRDEADRFIAGYTCFNDITERDLQRIDMAAGHPWLRSKGMDTFGPMGPWILLPDEINLPVELDVELRVNGELRQKDNTRNQTFDIPYLIEWISRYHTLYPGDVISTGTPEGMKPVVPGDIVEVFVERVGVLRNPIVSE